MPIDRTLLVDETRSFDERVQYLLDQMTLDEKIAQLVGVWVTDVIDDDHQFEERKARDKLLHGVGHISRVAASSLLPPEKSVRIANLIQKFLIEGSRLAIPAIVHEESCAGYMARGGTTFPQALGIAAAWEPDLVQKMTDVIRQQMRAVGAHHTLAPDLDVIRDPRWGRVEETFGEDPFLVSQLGVAYVKGVQGESLRDGIVATGKHFLAHGWSEGGLNWAPVHVGEREMREIFMTPFKAVIQEGHIASIMNAYHELDGVPVGSSREIMVDLLRDELGFDGVVASDYFTLRTLVSYHHVAGDAIEAARMGLEAGIDIELPAADVYGAPLKEALNKGAIPIALVDQSVKRVLKLKFELGLFDNPYVDDGKVAEVFNTPDQIALSRKLAQKTMVLLKNDGLLPLSKSLKSIAVIGPHAVSGRLMQGDYHYPSHLEHIFDNVNITDAPNPEQAPREIKKPFDWSEHFPPSVTALDGIKAAVSNGTEINYVNGCSVMDDDTSGFAEAVEAAKNAEVAILVLGDKAGLAVGASVGESIDSAQLRLPGVQQDLLEAVCATGTPVVLVLVTGRPYAISWAAENVPAIIEAWFPAQEGGAAIADVLFGDVNPGGKLPVTFPRHVGQVPIYYSHKPSGGRSNWHTNYRDLAVSPLFPFGHGLSYTTFKYSDLSLDKEQAGASDTVTVSVTVTNSGDRAGDEVVQLYVGDPVASVTRPVKALKGFKRITLQPKEQKTLRFQLDVRHLAFYDRQMQYVVEPGRIDVMVGSSSEDIRLADAFTITGDVTPVQQVFFTPVAVE